MMHRYFRSLSKRSTDERGAYFVIMTVGMVGLLAVAGLAIDLALMYREQLFLQKSADATVVAALNARIQAGAPSPVNPNFQSEAQLRAHIEARGLEIGNLNLDEANIPRNIVGSGAPAITISYITHQ